MDSLTAILRKDDPLLRPVKLGQQSFPGIWAAMMPRELFSSDWRFPAERQATCENCPKACYEGFRSDYRCCTYYPQIANFLLGLASESSVGETALQNLIQRGMLLPEGMQAAPQQWLDFLEDQRTDQFGRSQTVLCPLLVADSGLCSVHAFRNSVCSTYFCSSDHGLTGREFWMQIQTLGSQLEMALRQWALLEVGFDLDRYFRTLDSLAPRVTELSGATGWTDEVLRRLWGDWYGRERELLRACAAAIALHRDELWEIANRFPLRKARAFEKALDALAPDFAAGDDYEEISPEVSWDNCKEIHAQLWAWPEGAYRLSPCVTFVANGRADAEGLYHHGEDVFLEYRFGDDLQWRLAMRTAEKNLVLLFQNEPQTLDQGLVKAKALLGANAKTFLWEMLNRKVLWPFRDLR